MGANTSDESRLWGRARDGDGGAFAALFDAHRDRVFWQALRFTGSAHDAEDVTAMTFLEAWRRRRAVRIVNGSIIAWLLVTANNVSRNTIRSRRRYNAFLTGLPPEDTEDRAFVDVDDRMDGERRDARLREVFAQLPARDQDVLTLCVIEELSTEEAARALGIPPGTVKSRLSRAKRRLADLVTPRLSDSEIPGGAR